MLSPYTIEDLEGTKSLLKSILHCSMTAFMLCFIHATATANVYAIDCCFLSLFLTLSIGGAYWHLIDGSSWALVFDVINLVIMISIILQDVWSTLKACKSTSIGEKPKHTASEDPLFKREAQLKNREKVLSKRKTKRANYIANYVANVLLSWIRLLVMAICTILIGLYIIYRVLEDNLPHELDALLWGFFVLSPAKV
ncbi:hypothetical protein KCU67_g7895, partial [Aureobasidium melanogenum]